MTVSSPRGAPSITITNTIYLYPSPSVLHCKKNSADPSLTGFRTRHTRSRPSLRIRTVCQPNVDISSAMAMTHPPNPNSSSFLVLPRRDFAVNVTRLLPACASYVPFTSSSIERSHNDTNIVMAFFACEKFELRRIELSKILFISCSLNTSVPSNRVPRV